MLTINHVPSTQQCPINIRTLKACIPIAHIAATRCSFPVRPCLLSGIVTLDYDPRTDLFHKNLTVTCTLWPRYFVIMSYYEAAVHFISR